MTTNCLSTESGLHGATSVYFAAGFQGNFMGITGDFRGRRWRLSGVCPRWSAVTRGQGGHFARKHSLPS
jgi:hypothetical protein